MAIGSTDGSIRFYKSETLLTKATTCYKGIKEPIAAMAISPDSSTVVVTTDAKKCWAVRANVIVSFKLDWLRDMQLLRRLASALETSSTSWALP